MVRSGAGRGAEMGGLISALGTLLLSAALALRPAISNPQAPRADRINWRSREAAPFLFEACRIARQH